MGKIFVLPDLLSNRIAAGEVVERPASVVKELAENSLDAGARTVEVALEAGGRALIRIADDGGGMDREDLLLSIERHATSKVSSPEDLEAIRTLGFRGEALPAIASVSLMRITTCDSEGGAGWRLALHGGKLEEVEEAPARRGTVVEVRSLFFNTPARRKFLRSEQRETALVAESLTCLALAHHHCGFTLVSGERKLLSAGPALSRAERVSSLLGSGERLLAAFHQARGIRVEGFVSGAGESRPDRSSQRLLVNLRPVKDRTVAHAIAQIFGPILPPGRFPLVVLYIDLPPGEVDVNVHPCKGEVKFRRPGEVHDAVVRALEQALAGSRGLKPFPLPAAVTSSSLLSATDLSQPLHLGSLGIRLGVSEALEAFHPEQSSAPPESLVTAGAGVWEGLRVLGQYRNSYILAGDGEGLLMVDQHAAHERVLYEQLLCRPPGTDAASQPYLAPVVVELGAVERVRFQDCVGELSGLGFDVESFGQDSAVVRALPALFSGSEPAQLLRDMLADLGRDRRVAGEGELERFPAEEAVTARRRILAASAACQAAIKVNFPLTAQKMAWLLGSLSGCRVPKTCPHGRPTTLRMDHRAIERAFLRA